MTSRPFASISIFGFFLSVTFCQRSPSCGSEAFLASAAACLCALSSAMISSLERFLPATGGGGAMLPFFATFPFFKASTSTSPSFSSSSSTSAASARFGSSSSSTVPSPVPMTSSPLRTRSSNCRSKPFTRCELAASPPVILSLRASNISLEIWPSFICSSSAFTLSALSFASSLPSPSALAFARSVYPAPNLTPLGA